MNKQELQTLIDSCHENGKKAAVSFCSHVPAELLDAAGLSATYSLCPWCGRFCFQNSDSQSMSGH